MPPADGCSSLSGNGTRNESCLLRPQRAGAPEKKKENRRRDIPSYLFVLHGYVNAIQCNSMQYNSVQRHPIQFNAIQNNRVTAKATLWSLCLKHALVQYPKRTYIGATFLFIRTNHTSAEQPTTCTCQHSRVLCKQVWRRNHPSVHPVLY